MTTSVEVGGIVVRLLADAKQLEAALSKGSADLKKFGGEADKTGRQVKASADATTSAITGVVTRLGGLLAAYVSVSSAIQAFNNAMSNVTALDHLSQATGVGIERLSELRNIALAMGVDFDTLGRTLAQFGPRMNEALSSPTSRGSQALRALGVEVRDAQGNIRQLDELLPTLAERFSQFANGSNKAAISAALFGEEAGPKMLALLNKGKDGLEEIRRTLGSTYTAEDVERVRSYREALASLQVVFEKAVITIARFFDAFMRHRGAMPGAEGEVERLTEAVRRQEMRVRSLSEVMDSSMRLRGRIAQGDKDAHERAQVTLEDLRGQLAAEQALAAMRESAYGQRQRQVQQAPAMDPFALEKAQIALDRIMERLSGQRDIFDSINLSWEEHSRVVQQALAQIDRTHEQGHRREAARHRLAMDQRRQEQQSILDTVTATANAITAIWPKQKGAAIAAAIINTAVGVTNALKQGVPPWNFAQAALIAAAGAAQIAQIRSTSETGGSSTAAPTPTAAPVEAQEAGPSRSLHIQGVDPASWFSGRQVEELIRSINTEVQNGATLISTRNLPI